MSESAGRDAWLAAEFEQHRPRLRALAYRMLGSDASADDAVQESWLRLSRTSQDAQADSIGNLGGWLTTVVSRVCLDQLRSRATRREQAIPDGIDPADARAADPEQQAVDAQYVGLALQVVLDTLEPAERLAFVLHDLFGVPFDDIAPIIGRSSGAARQLASRARRRIRGAEQPDRVRQREVVEAFLAAARHGDLQRLLELLAPDVEFRADRTAVESAAAALAQGLPAPLIVPEARGAAAVAEVFNGRAVGGRPALIDGTVGFAWFHRGELRSVFSVSVRDDRIIAIDLVSDLDEIAAREVELLPAR